MPARRGADHGAPRRAFFFILPNLADDDGLDVYTFRLLAHYQRTAGPNGACAEPTAATAARCRMSPRRLAQARAELVAAGWIHLSYQGPAGQQVPVVRVVDRMTDNVARYRRAPEPTDEVVTCASPPAPGAAAARSTCPPPPHQVQALNRYPERTPETPENPPVPPHAVVEQPQQGEGVEPTESTCPSPPPGTAQDEPARARVLVEAFYRGLGASIENVTLPLRRRELAIGRQLVAVGATPAEAEAYARETSGLSGRIAAVDLRSFERERLGWLARRRGPNHSARRSLDRTGQPPSWWRSDLQGDWDPAPSGATRAPGGPAAGAVPPSAGGVGERIGPSLRALLGAR